MGKKAVLFDFDGTLADTLPICFEAFKYVFRQYDDRDITEKEIIGMFGPTEDEIIERNLQSTNEIQNAIEDYFSFYEKGHDRSFQLIEEIKGLLEFLKERNMKLGIITGKSRRGLDITLKCLKIEDHFDISIAGDEVLKPKPDGEGILKALEFLGLERNDVIFVGDSRADIAAGRHAQVATAAAQWFDSVQSTSFDEEPDVLCKSIGDLKDYVNRVAVPVL
ncbi:HAD family hydrolase [Bacillus infantis]|uniref:HAD family hydrolase n=1 Tax=Bacillus infantis TaxID=324767 RepID=UPI002FBF09A8